ncbi:MAG: beta-N-acetylglucosaminidase domain-containing protein [Clostridia bacterium]|nr:beta-N-acetylglucosaminidase domain-containing protein [Clostridia bacterium]
MIYPVPQKNNLNGEAINVSSLYVEGEYKALAEHILSGYGISVKGGFALDIIVSDSRKTTYIEELSRLSSEKYFITASEDRITVEASCRSGVFRAVHTLAKLVVKGELRAGTLEDYPLFERRGYIEGFYGPTWKHEKRLSVMRLMAKYGMNTFYYAPKDDEYHRAKWNKPYPDKELSELKELFDTAAENELNVCWCVGPGLTYHYTSEADFEALIAKFRNVYSIGVRNFGLLLDDIANDFQYADDSQEYDGIVDAHIVLVNKTYKALKEIDSEISLTVCPTQYFGDAEDYYISKFGSGLSAEVKIFWTGKEICSTFLTCRDADDFARSTKHKPLYWDNYPVNDAEMFNEMHLGAVKGRDKELYKHSDGLISNVMEYAEASKIPLMTIADYLWNPIAYDCEKSLKNAQCEILGDKAEIFKYIADHLCVACVSRHGSAMMSDILSHLSFLLATGEKSSAITEFKEYNAKMRECLAVVSDTSVELFAEIQKWVKKFAMCCDVLDAILAVWENTTAENKKNLKKLMDAYNSDAVILTGFCLRETAEKTLEL